MMPRRNHIIAAIVGLSLGCAAAWVSTRTQADQPNDDGDCPPDAIYLIDWQPDPAEAMPKPPHNEQGASFPAWLFPPGADANHDGAVDAADLPLIPPGALRDYVAASLQAACPLCWIWDHIINPPNHEGPHHRVKGGTRG